MNSGIVIKEAITYFGADIRRISHLLKVYGYAKTIGEMEQLPNKEQETLEIAAALHDIGIKNSEQKYHSSAGNYQEIEGPPVAREILTALNYNDQLIQRVEYLIGHHHTYHNIEGKDYQILVEADFLVNADEDQMSVESIQAVRDKLFQTKSGIQLLNTIYLQNS